MSEEGDSKNHLFITACVGVILPGRSLSLGFIFKSPNPGIFAESWEVVTRPVLLSSDGRSPILLTLKGVSFQPDLYHEKRAEIEVSECFCV